MKAIVQTGPEAVTLQDLKIPTPGPDEVLIEVHSAGLCGSDAHAYRYEEGYKWIPIPRIMGHEYSGTVADVGTDVEEFEPGDRVIEAPIHHCGRCVHCKSGRENVCENFSITGMHRDGAYAEYVTVDERYLHRIPDGVSLTDAAITEPTSVAARAVSERSTVGPGDAVLVEGPGPIGVLVAVIADATGADVLVSGLGKDGHYRLPLLADLGIETIDVDEGELDGRTDTFTDGVGFDVVFDTTGHASGLETAIEGVRKGGEIVVVGLPGQPSEVFMTPVVRREVTIDTSYGSLWSDFDRALSLLESGRVVASSIIDTSYDLTEPERAFESFLASETCKPVFDFASL